jgi:hypothetical protein
VGAYENRVYVSSYQPTSASTTVAPYVQWPDISLLDSDGWSFDISPSNAEQVQMLVDGDGMFILTNEASYVLTSLAPNTEPYRIFGRGPLGRQAACWAEDQLFVASHDSIYVLANRSGTGELSKDVRRMYKEWLNPDSTTTVTYQNRSLYVTCGTKQMRYSFVKQRWTRNTVAHTFLFGVMFRNPSSAIQNMWHLTGDRKIMRWQPADAVGSTNAATTDDGTTIPSWQYSTGFDFTSIKTRLRSILTDATAPLQVYLHKTIDDTEGQGFELPATEHQTPIPPDPSYKFRIRLVGLGGGTLKRLMIERDQVQQEGKST